MYAVVSLVVVLRSLFQKSPQISQNLDSNGVPKPEPYLNTDTSFQQFMKGFSIINYHFRVDFPLYNHLRYFLGVLMIFSLKVLSTFKHKPSITPFFSDEACKLALQGYSFFLVFFLLLFMFIQLTIINHCNPVISGPVAHKIMVGVTAVGAVVTGVVSGHEAVISTETNPPKFPGVSNYQKHVQGFSSDTAIGNKVGNEHRYKLDSLPPVKEDGSVDLKKTREALKAFDREEARDFGETTAEGAARGVGRGLGHGLIKGVTKGAIDGVTESTVGKTASWWFSSESTKK
jgi:hypothetical protein